MAESAVGGGTAQPTWAGWAWGQWLITALFVGFLVYLAGNLTTPSALLNRLAHPQWGWAVVALAAQAISFALYGGLYRYGFQAVGVMASARRLVGVIFASIFVKTVVPLAGAAVMTVFIDDAASRGQSGARAAAGTVVVTAIDLLVGAPLVAVGMLALARQGHLATYDVVGSGLFFGFIVVLVLGLIASGRYPTIMTFILRIARTVVNRIGGLTRRPELVSEGWVMRNADQFVAAAAAIPERRRDIAISGAFSVLLHIVNIGVVFALFLALGHTPSLGVVLAGLGAATVFFVVSIVPDGIGAVEGAMSLTFVSLRVDPATAILVTLGYRVLTVWIPVVLGFFAARQLRLFGGRGVLAGVLPERPPATA